MELPATFTENNTLEEYVASMTRTTTRREDVSREKLLQFTGFSQLPTGVYVIAANVPANSTTASYFIPIQGITFGTVDTSGWGAPFISPHNISSFGEATGTHIRAKNDLSGLFLGKPTLTIWATPVEETSIISSKTTTAEMPAILMDENLSPEDREAREKGLALTARIEYLYRTDEGFRRWYHEGIDEIEAGHFVTFSEDGWKEE